MRPRMSSDFPPHFLSVQNPHDPGMQYSRITSEPSICGGRPCVRDTRIRVADVLSLLAHGADTQEILTDYPLLETEDISACLLHAAEQSEGVLLRAS